MKKKIAIIGAKGLPARDGISSVVESYIKYLTDKYEFTIFCTEAYTERKSGSYDGYKEVVLDKIKNIRLNTLWYYIKAVWRILFCEKYDLIHFHHCDSAFLFPLVRIKYGKKVVVTTHGAFTKINDKWEKYKWYFLLQYRLFLRIAPYLTSVSKNEQKKTKNILGRYSEFIPNGVNLKEEISDNDVGKDYLFFSAGRIMAIKGLDVMLEALHKINYTGKIIIAGDITFAPQKFKDRIFKLSEGLDVSFLGLIIDKSLLYRYLRNAKLFIFPSNAETMSVQLLEAASMQVPIVASDIVENTDVFSEDEVLFFKTDDSEDLAKKIEYAFANEEQMQQKSKRAYQTLKDNYSWAVIAEKYSEVYQRVLEK